MFPEIPNKQPIIIESATLDTFTNSYSQVFTQKINSKPVRDIIQWLCDFLNFHLKIINQTYLAKKLDK